MIHYYKVIHQFLPIHNEALEHNTKRGKFGGWGGWEGGWGKTNVWESGMCVMCVCVMCVYVCVCVFTCQNCSLVPTPVFVACNGKAWRPYHMQWCTRTSGGHLKEWHCTAVGRLFEPEKHCQDGLMSTSQSLLNTFPWSTVVVGWNTRRKMTAFTLWFFRECATPPDIHLKSRYLSVCVKHFMRPSPALVLRVTTLEWEGLGTAGNKHCRQQTLQATNTAGNKHRGEKAWVLQATGLGVRLSTQTVQLS